MLKSLRAWWWRLRFVSSPAPLITLRPGDLLILQPSEPLSKATIERLHKDWEARFGGYYPMAVLPSGWKITVAGEEAAVNGGSQ
jgi:hypothetical protein